jgi:hypothetical protein
MTWGTRAGSQTNALRSSGCSARSLQNQTMRRVVASNSPGHGSIHSGSATRDLTG